MLYIEACNKKNETDDVPDSPETIDWNNDCPDQSLTYDNPESILTCTVGRCGKILTGCYIKEGGSSKILAENLDSRPINYTVELKCSYQIGGHDNNFEVFLSAGDELTKVPVWCKHSSDFIQYTVTGNGNLVIDVTGMRDQVVIGRVDLAVRNITSN